MTKEEKERKKMLKEVEKIAKAFLRMRNRFPVDPVHFRLLCGAKEAKVFYDTMYMLNQRAESLGYNFGWYFNEITKKWDYYLKPLMINGKAVLNE